MRLGSSRGLTNFSKIMEGLQKIMCTQIEILVPRLRTVKKEIEKELGLSASCERKD